MGLEKYAIDSNPIANEGAIIKGECFRITILTDALARFEYSKTGEFEDRPTQKVVNRLFDVPEYRVREDDELHIFTSKLGWYSSGAEYMVILFVFIIIYVSVWGISWWLSKRDEEIINIALKKNRDTE